MRKKVLIAESSDPIRTVAETVLRQNGYEVISVTSADRAKEVLQFSKPDLLLLGADLCGRDQRPFYERVQADPRMAAIPLLLFEAEQKEDLPFPPEVVLSRPLDPKDLLQRVSTFAGATPPSQPKASGPLDSGSVDDEFLDAALGLDRIDVTKSEMLDQTSSFQPAPVHKAEEKGTSVGSGHREPEEMADSSRVESLMIRDEHAEIVRQAQSKPPVKPASSGTSKLEIMADQYGLTDPAAFAAEHKDENHDYDWFIKSMAEENQAPSGSAKTNAHSAAHDSELRFTDHASTAHPVTPVTPVKPALKPGVKGDVQSSSGGVEKFIDEFKKEIERLRSSESDDLSVAENRVDSASQVGQLRWEDTVERTDPQQVQMFTRELASELAEKLAVIIAAKIDPDKLLQLVKSEIIARSSGKHT